MDFKKFKPVAQDQDSYTVMHPGGKKLFIEKAKLSKDAHKQILHLFQGAMVDPAVDGTSNAVPDQSISDLGGGDPMASQLGNFGAEMGKLAGKSILINREPQSDDADYKEYAPDLTKEDIADLDAPVLNKDGTPATGVNTDPAAVKSRAKMAQMVSQFPVPTGQDSASLMPQVAAQGMAIAQAGSQGRGPDAVPPGDPLMQEKSGASGLLQEQIQQQEQALAAGQSGGQDIANVQQEGANALAKLPSYNDIVSGYQAKDQKLAQDYAEAKVDPEHFLHTMGTGSKILTGIGMVLSGMGAATTGQPSYAMQVVNDAIKRDVDSQKDSQGQKLNLWKMNREALGNDTSANLATENQIKAGVLAKLQAAQTRAALPQEKLRAQQAIDQIKGEMLKNNMMRGLLTQGQQGAAANGGGALSNADPSMLVPEMVKDPAQQKAVYEEIKNRANISKNGVAMLKAFDQAANEVSGAGGVLHSAIEKTPGQLALDQLMKPNMSELDGTIRHEAVAGAQETMIPSFKDLGRPDRIASKRQSLIDWMKSQQSAPVSKGNYIDLDRFQGTAIPNTPAAAAQPQTIERKAKDGRIIVYDAKTKQPIGVKK